MGIEIVNSCLNCKYGDYDVDREPCATCILVPDYDAWEKEPPKTSKTIFGGGI